MECDIMKIEKDYESCVERIDEQNKKAMVSISKAIDIMNEDYPEAKIEQDLAFEKILEKNLKKFNGYELSYIYRISIAETMLAFYGDTHIYQCFDSKRDDEPDKIVVECIGDYRS
jgi:hypothetical protein